MTARWDGPGKLVVRNQRFVMLVREEGRPDQVMLDVPMFGMTIQVENDFEEIRSNPSLFALLAGAPMEEVLELPGEQVAQLLRGRKITINQPVMKLSEFRPALPGE